MGRPSEGSTDFCRNDFCRIGKCPATFADLDICRLDLCRPDFCRFGPMPILDFCRSATFAENAKLEDFCRSATFAENAPLEDSCHYETFAENSSLEDICRPATFADSLFYKLQVDDYLNLYTNGFIVVVACILKAVLRWASGWCRSDQVQTHL